VLGLLLSFDLLGHKGLQFLVFFVDLFVLLLRRLKLDFKSVVELDRVNFLVKNLLVVVVHFGFVQNALYVFY